jgi:hypothetical protein
MPLGFRPLSTEALSSYIGTVEGPTTVLVTRRFASRSFVTRPTDNPAHQYVPGYLARNLTLGRRLNQAEDGQFGSLIEAVHGELELDNSEGQLDDMVEDFRADGRPVTLKIGATEVTSLGRERIQPYSLFETVYRTVAQDWYFEKNVVRLSLASQNKRLEDRLQLQVYAGTGGINGTSEMAGRSRPTALGRCLNTTPQLLDPSIVTYDLHAGEVSQIENVYDMGVEVPFAADYPTYDAMVAATVPAGWYATSKVAGKMRLGFLPAGDVTVDLRGDIDNSNGFYVGNHGSILRMIFRDYAGLTNADLDLTSFNTLNALQAFEMGLFLPAGDQSRVIDVAEQIAFSCGAFVGQDRSGLLRVQRLEVPAATPQWIFTDRDILQDRFERIRLPYRIPWRAWGVGYSRNWTVQTGSQLAAGVSQQRRTFLEAEYRYMYASDPKIAQAHLTSHGAPLRSSLFLSNVAAQAEATRLQALYSYERAMYRFVVKTALFSVELGQTVRLILNRYDLDNGKDFVVVGIFDEADSAETELTCFG